MKKFVSMGYFGLFMKGGQLPFICATSPDLCEAYKEKMETDDFYKQFKWVVKRCVMGRHLTPRAVDKGGAGSGPKVPPSK
jgi:hypothetical protein